MSCSAEQISDQKNTILDKKWGFESGKSNFRTPHLFWQIFKFFSIFHSLRLNTWFQQSSNSLYWRLWRKFALCYIIISRNREKYWKIDMARPKHSSGKISSTKKFSEPASFLNSFTDIFQALSYLLESTFPTSQSSRGYFDDHLYNFEKCDVKFYRN